MVGSLLKPGHRIDVTDKSGNSFAECRERLQPHAVPAKENYEARWVQRGEKEWVGALCGGAAEPTSVDECSLYSGIDHCHPSDLPLPNNRLLLITGPRLQYSMVRCPQYRFRFLKTNVYWLQT